MAIVELTESPFVAKRLAKETVKEVRYAPEDIKKLGSYLYVDTEHEGIKKIISSQGGCNQQAVNSDITLYAQWEELIKVTFNTGNYASTIDPVYVERNTTVGLLHDDYIITKKKGFNQEKIGYIKLKDDDSGIDKYVEVTKGKGAKDLIMWLLLIAIIILLSNFKLPEDWHF